MAREAVDAYEPIGAGGDVGYVVETKKVWHTIIVDDLPMDGAGTVDSSVAAEAGGGPESRGKRPGDEVGLIRRDVVSRTVVDRNGLDVGAQ
jgi:hypothetical protein